MKTKELIRQLQQADPSGEEEVVVDNHDIYFVEQVEAYLDGRAQQLIHDEQKRGKGYSIVGGKIRTKGWKVRLITMPLEDCLLGNPEMPVDVSEGNESDKVYWEQHRQEMRELIKRVHDEHLGELRVAALFKPNLCNVLTSLGKLPLPRVENVVKDQPVFVWTYCTRILSVDEALNLRVEQNNETVEKRRLTGPDEVVPELRKFFFEGKQ